MVVFTIAVCLSVYRCKMNRSLLMLKLAELVCLFKKCREVLVCHSGNVLDSINVVTLHQARLVPGWVTIFGRINHHATEPGTQVDSAWAIPSWVCKSEYWLWLQPPLGKKWRVLRNSRPCDQDCWHTILACSRLKVLVVNGAGHSADVGRMLA